jgi:hypothetical protein
MLKSFLQTVKKPLLTIIILTLLLTFIPFELTFTNNLNPLIFGVTFFLVNIKRVKHNIVIGLLLSIVASYAAYFTGLISFFGFSSVLELVANLKFETEIIIVLTGLIASLTLYLVFTRIYDIGQVKRGITIMATSYLLVPIALTFLLLFHIIRENEFFPLYNFIWLLVVGFFLTLTTNLDEKKRHAVD